MFSLPSIRDFFRGLIRWTKGSGITETEFLELEIRAWLTSKKRENMLTGRRYYDGMQDICDKQRTAIGEGGRERTVTNLPNSRLCDNRFAELVDQKVNYLLSKPIEVKTEDEAFKAALQLVFDTTFHRRLRNTGSDSMTAGIGYLHPYVSDGVLKFKRFNPEEILPFWRDEDHEELDSFLRIYPTYVYEGEQPKIIWRAEHYTTDGVRRYIWTDAQQLVADTQEPESYITYDGQPMNWERVPLVAFKYNAKEIPLICRVKCLQDALNTLVSNFADNMQEDVRHTILVIENYDGEDLADFRRNLIAYGAVKVRTDSDSGRGGVKTLTVEVNAANYEAIVKMLRRAIIENGRGFDAKDERMSNQPNQMNIRSIYSDIDLDADGMELEYQAALQQLMWFVRVYLGMRGQGSGDVEFIFNRDTPVNESEVINDCRASVGIISKETIVANHPWTKDTAEELKRLKQEEQEAGIGDYANPGGDGHDEE